MTRAFVYSILPSLQYSMKIATTGETIGTFKQDRSTAIAGTLGKGPELVPVTISLDTERGLRKTFAFQVVNDQLFTPLLTYVSILNTLSSVRARVRGGHLHGQGHARNCASTARWRSRTSSPATRRRSAPPPTSSRR